MDGGAGSGGPRRSQPKPRASFADFNNAMFTKDDQGAVLFAGAWFEAVLGELLDLHEVRHGRDLYDRIEAARKANLDRRQLFLPVDDDYFCRSPPG